MANIGYYLGFGLIPVLIVWSVIYSVIRFTGKKLSEGLQALTLITIHIITALIVGSMSDQVQNKYTVVMLVSLLVSLGVFRLVKGKLIDSK